MEEANESCSFMSNVNMLPVRGDDMVEDPRYRELAPRFPRPTQQRGRIWPKLPRGHYGIGIQATNEERQIEYFQPTDPRRIAVNFGGDRGCGSLICDLTENSEYDELRTAREQSIHWVIREPTG